MKKQIYRIIDVNLNRTREGLRVVEDICRFYLNDKKLSSEIKTLRHIISRSIDRGSVVAFRNSEGDLGRKKHYDKVKDVKNVKEVLIANLIRAEEGVRVLEEFSKLIDPDLTGLYKKTRFSLYDIEKKLLKKN